MKPLLSIKTLYRSPVRTALTFILLAVVSFALFSQTAEYAVIVRETGEAAGQYHGVGAMEITPPDDIPGIVDTSSPRSISSTRYESLIQEQIDAVSELPYITSVDRRYMTAGLSDVFYRPDDGEYFYNYTARCVIAGTLSEVQYGEPMEDAASLMPDNYNRLILEDCELLAGAPPWAVSGETLTVLADPMTYEDLRTAIGGASNRLLAIHDDAYTYGTDYIKLLAPGARYAFTVRFEPLGIPYGEELVEQREYYLYDHLAEPRCKAVWPLEGAPDDYLDADDFAPLRELVEITNADAHTFDMVYTDDMSAIMRFAEGKMAIADGRALTPEDSASGLNVCVISRELAFENNLAVGDTLTVRLGTKLFEQYKGLGAIAATQERYSSALAEPVTLEIAGIYADVDGNVAQANDPNWSYSVSTIFVPKSLLRVDEGDLTDHAFSPSEFSFKVENAWDIPAFLEETAPAFEAMGLRLMFHDDGWFDIVGGFETAKRLSLIRIAVLTAAAAAAIWFVVYLFIGRKKKEYAVMRALGTPGGASAKALAIPFMALTVIAVAAGSAAAWIYTAKTIADDETLSTLGEYSANASVPAAAALGCIFGEILLALIAAYTLLRRIGSRSPLALIQDDSGVRRKKSPHGRAPRDQRADLTSTAPATPSHGAVGKISPDIVESARETTFSRVRAAAQKKGTVRFAARYILRHARRSAGKSALALVLAALLLCAIGQFVLMRQSYAELRDDTVVKANFAGGLPLSYVPSITGSGYTKDPYYEAIVEASMNLINTDFIITNNISRLTGEDTDVKYAEGFDASCMDAPGEIVILGETLAALHGAEPGGVVQVVPRFTPDQVRYEYVENYKMLHPESDMSDDEIAALLRDKIEEEISKAAQIYTIAGIVSTPSGSYNMSAFTPGVREDTKSFGFSIELDVAEFTLADNRLAGEMREYGEKMADGSLVGRVDFIMDTSKLDNLVKTLNLLNALYPIAVAAALLIGGFLCSLVIFQSSKDAAIMRIQGTTKRKTRLILALEQIFLSVAGLALGACALLAYNGSELTAVGGLALFTCLYFAAVVAASAVSSAAATRKNVLELLQTKE
ncbi:MAG: ABC transporter permease [Oscillospiraceae bacterium]|jgi:ABC-type lipoprotein release transport system permease subunit|nr:ABC transporter permease [Oscillospiraceae bacterium]